MKIWVGLIWFLCSIIPSVSWAANTELNEPSTGLSLSAPQGASLTSSSSGIYTLRIKKSWAKFMLARSPFTFANTVASFLKLSKAKVSSKTTKGNKVTIKGTVRGKPVIIQLTKVGSYIDVVTFGGSSGGKKKGAGVVPRAGSFITPADVLALQRALNTRRGGVTVPLNVSIPTKVFRAADGTSATVPNLPGWSFSGGGGGIISGANPTQGLFEFGVPAVVSRIGGGPINSPSYAILDAQQAISAIFPQYASVYAGANVQVVGVALVPGTQGFLAPDFISSGLFVFAFNMNGQTWQGLMSSGTTPLPAAEAISYIWYHSYIAVPSNGPGGIAPALMDTWASWNHTAADQARLRQAFQTLLSIQIPGSPIDDKVFEKTANAWDEYIRGDGN